MSQARFLIATECMNITSAMRHSPRWSGAGIVTILSSQQDPPNVPADADKDGDVDVLESTQKLSLDEDQVNYKMENKLISDLTALRAQIVSTKGEIDVLQVLQPFLNLVVTEFVSGQITLLALNSIKKFLEFNVISEESANIEGILTTLTQHLSKCKFESHDHDEEVVLISVVDLFSRIVCGPLGKLLSGKSVDDVLKTCINVLNQTKSSSPLHEFGISTLFTLTKLVFQAKLKCSLLKKFVDILSQNYPLSLKIVVLNALQIAFEFEVKENELTNELWMHLAQLIRVAKHPKLLRASLQLVIKIMQASPQLYKTQFEFVLIYLLTSLTPLNDLPRDESNAGADDMFYAGVPNRARSVKSAPVESGSNVLILPTAALSKTPEIREVMVEALSTLAVSLPSFFPDLFLSYDCDIEYPDLCEDLLGFLCRYAYPDSASWSSSNVPPLCLEAVLQGLGFWAHAENDTFNSEIKKKLELKAKKNTITEVAEIFNEKPKRGIAEMVKTGLIQNDEPANVAEFLFKCSALNKAVLGKFFAAVESKEIFIEYLKHLDFTNLRLDEALRMMLCYLRIPGEGGEVDRLVEVFAQRYIDSGEKPEKDLERAHVLSYAVLMLNTDHHSSSIKQRKKMTYEDFHQNVVGCGVDASDEYVRGIYDAVTTNELIVPDEHDTDETFEHSWRTQVVQNTHADPTFALSNCQSDVLKAMFDLNWRPIVSTLSFVFATATDDLVFRRVITGFHELAQLATKFKSHKALNHVVACLSQISALSTGDLQFNNSNIEIRIEDHMRVIVSDLSTQFGGDLKAQMASITLFRILNLSASEVSEEAMGLIAKALTNLYLYGLYKPNKLINVKPIHLFHSFERSKAGKPVGILSALSSYLTSSPDAPSEPSDENVDAALGAYDCIKACNLDEVISALIESSPIQFANGILSVLPTSDEPQFLPAKDFLLNLAGHAVANQSPDLQHEIATKALDAKLISTALQIADDSLRQEILNNLKTIDTETLDVLLTLEPSQSLFKAIGRIETPPTSEIFAFVNTNVSHICENDESLLSVLKTISIEGEDLDLHSVELDQQLITTLESLAKHTRQELPRYLKVLGSLAQLCGRRNAEVRDTALTSLQKEFLLDDQKITFAAASNEVLIPHVLEVIVQPTVWKKDPNGMDATRQQVASLIGKVFLHLTHTLNKEETSEDVDAWISVIKMLERLLTSRRQPALQESIEEMLKNVILVTKLQEKSSAYFWDLTEKELKGFLPEIAKLTKSAKEEKAENS